MAGVKGLLARVRRLEPKAGHVARRLGSFERFEAECMRGVEEGRYDPEDMPQVVYCVRRWIEQGL
jgi:hypothetical protein